MGSRISSVQFQLKLLIFEILIELERLKRLVLL